jgi:hypothetical protein
MIIDEYKFAKNGFGKYVHSTINCYLNEINVSDDVGAFVSDVSAL